MYYVSPHRPDCRVFIKRLVIPAEEIVVPTGTQTAGLGGVTSATSVSDEVLNQAFAGYTPKVLLPQLIASYKTKYALMMKKKTDDIATQTKISADLAEEISWLEWKYKATLDITEKNDIAQQLTDKKNLKIITDTYINDLKNSQHTVRPIYEPVLLEVALGVASVTTTIVRNGMGSATITLKLPLEENGFQENILFAIDSPEMWDIEKITAGLKSSSAQPISPRQINIFKLIMDSANPPKEIGIDRRECSLLPMDMIQVWFTKRYADTETVTSTTKTQVQIPTFPDDYLPGFTGFIKETHVNFTGGQSPSYTITITCEDCGKPLRISRANIDPALDPQYRLDGLDVTAWINKLHQPGTFQSGTDLIKSLIVGKQGFWGGASQIEIIDDVEYAVDETGKGQYVKVKEAESSEKNAVRGVYEYRGTTKTDMAWEFDQIPFNAYEDMINSQWLPYVSALKSTFKLWESDYKYKWDICKEVAEVMEFEFYVDNFGVINYHPPFYNWNPANIKYFIENKEVKSENHTMSETNVVTAVEIVTQAQLGIPDNICKILSAFAKADNELVQRYGVRFRTKNLPFLSGTEKGAQAGPASPTTRLARNLYARAWLNRRNAELKSATVEIPGTPEMFLCNTVAFIDDIGDFVGETILNKDNVTAQNVGQIANVNIGKYKKISSDFVNNLKVYYVTGVTHKYAQGGNFSTNLVLSHGRVWGKQWDVGYALSEEDSKALLDAMKKKEFKQDPDSSEQIKKMVQKGIKTINTTPATASISNNARKQRAKMIVRPKGTVV